MVTRRKSSIGDDLLESMGQALDHARGKKVAVRATNFAVPAMAVKQIRKKVGLNQDAFAGILGVSVSGLRKWEQGNRIPRGAALSLLRIMDAEPTVVSRILAKAD